MGLALHVLKNAGVAPPWIEANKAIAKVNLEAPASTKRRPLLVLEEELARYEEACRR